MRQTLLLALVAAGALSACGSSDQEEIQQWMQEQRAQTKPNVQPIPEPKKFTPQDYTQEAAVEPFSNQKLAQALKRDSQQSSSATPRCWRPN
jgi:type IV pilus assembly protein PilP